MIFEYRGIRKIISGGQTGADQAGLLTASARGIETGGYAPLNWRTEDGPAPFLAEFGLQQTPDPGYTYRTKLNIQHSDATLIVAANFLSPGTKRTALLLKKMNKPFFLFHISTFDIDALSEIAMQKSVDFVKFVEKSQPLVLNIAGNRDNRQRQISECSVVVLRIFLEALASSNLISTIDESKEAVYNA